MNQKTCKICGGVLIGLSLGQFLVCSECGFKYDFCNQPDLPTQLLSASSPTSSSVNISAASTTTLPTPSDEIS